MTRISHSADQLIGRTPLLELHHIEQIEGLKAQKRRIAEFIRVFEAAGEEYSDDNWCGIVERLTVFPDRMVFTLTTGREIEV